MRDGGYDAERASFEQWASCQGYELHRRAVSYGPTGSLGRYTDSDTRSAWEAWQARAALFADADGNQDGHTDPKGMRVGR